MKRMFLLCATVAFVSACGETPVSPGSMPVTTGLTHGDLTTSHNGVVPDSFPGNIPDELEGAETCTFVNERDGLSLLTGFRWEDSETDPLADRDDLEFAGFTFDVSSDGKFLSWFGDENIMRVVLVKGGNNWHEYWYNDPVDGPELDEDSELRSPQNPGGQIPEISWFAFCYEEGLAEFEGCGAGFWQQNATNFNASQWPAGYEPTDLVDDVFDVPATFTNTTGQTLLTALGWTAGGPGDEPKAQQLLRQAVAAVLSAAHPDVNYPRSVSDIVADVNAALADDADAMEALKDELDADNNLGCPLSQDNG